MNFSSNVFIFIFFPLSVLLFYVVKFAETLSKVGNYIIRFRCADLLLILVSLLFYDLFFCNWTSAQSAKSLLLLVLFVYLCGKICEKLSDVGNRVILRTAVFVIAISLILGILLYYKYLSAFLWYWNHYISAFQISVINGKNIIAPLGISFVVFSAISYVVDIFRKKARAGSLIDCALYLTFFPKLLSGPIALWKNFCLSRRELSLSQFLDGLNLIVIGLTKKVLFADQFGLYIRSIPNKEISAGVAWLVAFFYMLQIYLDFSGYSDVAIGLAKLFGYEFEDNFYYPYQSCSISDFWRRWHISLGQWFKEYVYLSMGGDTQPDFVLYKIWRQYSF